MQGTDKQIHDILIRFATEDLRSKYCWFISRGDSHEIAELFVPDGVYEFLHEANLRPPRVGER